MATDTVLISHVTGTAWMRTADGQLIALHEGMRVPVNAHILTDERASVTLQAHGVPPVILGQNTDVLVTDDLAQARPQPVDNAVAPPADSVASQVLAALDAGQDPFAVLDPTAAVLTGGGGGGASFTRLASVAETVSPLDLAYPRPGVETPEFVLLGGAAPAAAGGGGGGNELPGDGGGQPGGDGGGDTPSENTLPRIVGGNAVSISEEGLPNGLADGVDNQAGAWPDTSDSPAASGTLVMSDADGDPVVVVGLVKPAAALTSSHELIVWSYGLDGEGHENRLELIGKVGDREVIVITITADGHYEVSLTGQIDHPIKGAEDVLELGVGVEISDGHGTNTGTLTISIEDDSPEFGVVTDATLLNQVGITTESLVFHSGADVEGSSFGITGIDLRTKGYSADFEDGGKTAVIYADGQKDNPLYLLTLNGNGTYSVEQRYVLTGEPTAVSLPGQAIPNPPTDHYDWGSVQVWALSGQTLNASTANGFGVGSNTHFETGESFKLTFADSVTGFTLSVKNVWDPGKVSVELWLDGTKVGTVDDIQISSTGTPLVVAGGILFDTAVIVGGAGTGPAHGHNEPKGLDIGFGGDVSYTTIGPAHAPDFTVRVAGADGDGDSVSTEFNVGGYEPAIRLSAQADHQGATFGLPADGHDNLGNDLVYGTDRADGLHGGKGNDALYGGAGDDVFVWTLGDQGTSDHPAQDRVMDFGAGGAEGRDVLDLSDLLQHHTDGAAPGDHGDLTQYLNISSGTGVNEGKTIINVSTDGDVANSHDQQIVIDNVDLAAGHDNLDTAAGQAQLINSLINDGKLKVDSH